MHRQYLGLYNRFPLHSYLFNAARFYDREIPVFILRFARGLVHTVHPIPCARDEGTILARDSEQVDREGRKRQSVT